MKLDAKDVTPQLVEWLRLDPTWGERDPAGAEYDLQEYGEQREMAQEFYAHLSNSDQHSLALLHCLTRPKGVMGLGAVPTAPLPSAITSVQETGTQRYLRIAWAIAVLLLLLWIAARPAHAQFDAPIVQLKNQGTLLATRAAGLVVWSCSTNMTCTWDSASSTFTMTAASTAGTSWSSLTAPTLDLAMSHGAFSTTFTFGTLAGAGSRFKIQDTTGNTGTGYLWDLNTVGTSTLLPFRLTAGGTANGVDMTTAGLLRAIGTGGINATQYKGGNASGAGACVANNWVITLNDAAAPTCAQPAFNALTGSATLAQLPRGTTAGQLLQSNGSGADPTYVDPIVSFSYVTLFTAQSAAATATSSAIRLPTLSAVGSLDITGAGITGSPVGCQIDLRLQHQAGASVTSIATQAFTPAVSRQAFSIAPAAANVSGDTMIAVYTCTTYPTAGTITVGFDPITPISIVGTPGVNLSQYTPVSGRLPVDPSGVTSPISAASLPLPTLAATSTIQTDRTQKTQITDGTRDGTVKAASTLPVATDTAVVVTLRESLSTPVTAASLPLPTGASTAAKQPALGTAGTASTDVITVQGIAGMTKLLVTPDSVALPANQSVNVSQINSVTPLMGNGVTGTGSQRVTIASDNTAFSVNATLSAETTKVIGTVRTLGNAGAAFDAADGAAPPANDLAIGGLASGATGGLMAKPTICDQWVAINGTASAQLITGVASRKIYFCSGNIQMNGGANTVSFVSGTGTTCATGITAVPGFDGATAAANGYSFAANSGMAFGGGLAPFARTTNNADNFCILVGSATRVVGGLNYAIY